jgi:dihydrofolate synthase/folylpolyglutamate synthase
VEQASAPAGGEAVSLTYFEFTTLAILWRAGAQRAGCGRFWRWGWAGAWMRCNIVDPDCAVITSIDLDHMELLGTRPREPSAGEKAGIMRTGRPVVVSDPVPPPSVLDVRAAPSVPTCGASGADFQYRPATREQWGWSVRAGRPLQRPGLPGAARRQPAGQRRRRAGAP